MISIVTQTDALLLGRFHTYGNSDVGCDPAPRCMPSWACFLNIYANLMRFGRVFELLCNHDAIPTFILIPQCFEKVLEQNNNHISWSSSTIYASATKGSRFRKIVMNLSQVDVMVAPIERGLAFSSVFTEVERGALLAHTVTYLSRRNFVMPPCPQFYYWLTGAWRFKIARRFNCIFLILGWPQNIIVDPEFWDFGMNLKLLISFAILGQAWGNKLFPSRFWDGPGIFSSRLSFSRFLGRARDYFFMNFKPAPTNYILQVLEWTGKLKNGDKSCGDNLCRAGTSSDFEGFGFDGFTVFRDKFFQEREPIVLQLLSPGLHNFKWKRVFFPYEVVFLPLDYAIWSGNEFLLSLTWSEEYSCWSKVKWRQKLLP